MYFWIIKYFGSNHPSIVFKKRVSCSKVSLREFELSKKLKIYVLKTY